MTTPRREFLRQAALGATVLAGRAWSAPASRRPHVLYILCDDLGYGDVHALNPEHGKIPTPHLDRLAAQGMAFTDCHGGSSVCTPTRYGLLTGRYAWRTRLQAGVLDGDAPPLIAADRLTVPGLLRAHGYHTAAFGKWHLGYGFDGPKRVGARVVDGPTTRGFDSFYGFHHARELRWLVDGDRVVEDLPAVEMLPRLTQRAAAHLVERARAGTPSFTYLALNSPHTPIVPSPEWRGRSRLNAYADYVMQTDDCIGQVLAALDRAGLAESTLVLCASDNGCSPAAKIAQLQRAGHEPSGIYRGFKSDLWDGGHRIPFLARWPGRVAAGVRNERLACLTDLLATCATMLGVDLPPNAGEDSFSLWGELLGTGRSARQDVIHHSISGRFALREADWKLELCAGSGGWGSPGEAEAKRLGLPPVQLYDLRADPAEQHNLAASQPREVERLRARLAAQVAAGRSTLGPPQRNDAPIDLLKGADHGADDARD